MKRILFSSLLSAVVAAGVTWVARGLFDELTMDEGVFHIVNADAVPRSIELTFPSGERRSAVLEAGRAVDLHVANTGEGAVSVRADGEVVGSVGYVTSQNSLSILVVQSDGALFSQYIRGQSFLP
jgi:hypothetical protein